MDELRSQAEAQTHLALGLRQELAIAQQALVDLHTHRDNVQRSLDEALRNIERLHAVSRDDTELLNERNAQLTAAQQELDQQAEALQGLEHSLSARDRLIEDLRAEMLTVQDERAIMAEKLTKSRARVKAMTQEIFIRDNRIAVLKSDLAVHTEALAAIRRDVDRIESPSTTAVEPPERMLEPVDHEGDPIVLNRRVMTIGRTNDNDIFIPSKMISRHHARLLVGPNAVIVEDAGSTNGCFVNDQQIKQHVLRDGDVLSIGDLKFRLSVRLPDGSRPRDNVVDFDPNRHLDG
jgi:pSer/pThr/pTyr-binding forkhead associated (FHA) protein